MVFQDKFGRGLILSAKVNCRPCEDLDSKTSSFITYVNKVSGKELRMNAADAAAERMRMRMWKHIYIKTHKNDSSCKRGKPTHTVELVKTC